MELSRDTITINITVAPVNDAPVITRGAGPLTKTVIEDGRQMDHPPELAATDVGIQPPAR